MLLQMIQEPAVMVPGCGYANKFRNPAKAYVITCTLIPPFSAAINPGTFYAPKNFIEWLNSTTIDNRLITNT